MPRGFRLIASVSALVLACVVSGCSQSGSKVPQASLVDDLRAVNDQTAAGDCADAQQKSLPRLDQSLAALAPTLPDALEQSLADSIKRVGDSVGAQCRPSVAQSTVPTSPPAKRVAAAKPPTQPAPPQPPKPQTKPGCSPPGPGPQAEAQVLWLPGVGPIAIVNQQSASSPNDSGCKTNKNKGKHHGHGAD